MRQLQDLAPVIIASPVRRSGTTLLQRLICSSKDSLIFGESCAGDFNLFVNFLINKDYLFGGQKEWRNQQLRNVLAGDTNDWIPDLMPDIDTYLERFQTAAFQVLSLYRDFAQQEGRTIWGMKSPEWNGHVLKQLLEVLPQSKLIYIHRNLTDCARSAKAIGMIQSLRDLEHFAATYRQNLQIVSPLDLTRILHVEYDELISNSAFLHSIEDFLQCTEIDERVLQFKVNEYFDASRASEGQRSYVKPATLTAEERDFLKQMHPE